MVICSPQLGLSPNSILGGEVFDREILLGLAKSGVKVEIILPQGKPHDQKIRNWHVTYLAISRFPAILGNLFYLPYLFKVYKKNPFQILRIHQPQFLGFAAIIFRIFNPKVKLLATYHQFGETKFFVFSKLINNFWDHIVTDSENARQSLIRKYKVNSKKITVTKNGIPKYLKPTPKDSKLKKKLALEGKFVLLFMGLFIERKNPIFLLDVLRQVVEYASNVTLIYWGDGPQKENIKRIAASYGILKNIRFQDPVYGPLKNKIHNLGDVFVHPSTDEGFALAPLEAMACAKPVIMNDLHSAKEAVENTRNGFLCRANDVANWTNRILILYKNKHLRKKLSKYSYLKAKRDFNWDQSARVHYEVLEELSKRN